MQQRFDGEVAIVTGGAQGIGLACVEKLAAEGAAVIIADVDGAKGERAATSLGQQGRRVAFVRCDVALKREVEGAVDAARDLYGPPSLLVNNAAIIHTAEFLDLDEADFERVLRVNVLGCFLAAQALARSMLLHGQQGAIVNLSSVNAVLAIPNQIPYVVSKGGIDQLTKVLALALAPRGIRVNAVGPGSIATDMLKVVMNDATARTRVLSRTPMGRLGEPAEIADAVAYLLSREASYVTGQTLYVDGGRLPLNYTVPVVG